jgi:cytochrome c5
MEYDQAIKDLKAAGKKLDAAKQRLAEARENAQEAAIAAQGARVYEVTISEHLGTDRMTVRRWLGKRNSRDHRAK